MPKQVCTNGPFSFVHHSCNPCRTNDGNRLKENHSCKWMHVWWFSIRALSVQACRAEQPDRSRPHTPPAGDSPSRLARSLAGPFLPSAGPFPRREIFGRGRRNHTGGATDPRGRAVTMTGSRSVIARRPAFAPGGARP
jgi:hypothetical protein